MKESVAQPDAQQAAWVVYINGIHVPCPSVTINYGVWKIPEAQLRFFPHRLLTRLGAEDRLEVAVFYLDTTYDPENPEFRLCFEGEIYGWSYQSTPLGRMIAFDAIADISVYQTLHFFYMNTVDAVVGYATDRPAQVNSVTGVGVHYPFSLFKKGLFLTDKDNQPDITRPYDLLDNSLRGILSAPPDGYDYRSVPTVNFYARWMRKRNFHNRFVALPKLEDNTTNPTAGVFPIFQAVQSDLAIKAMTSSLTSSVGEQGALFDVLQRVFGVAYSELAMLPTPAAVVARLRDGTILGPASSYHSDPQLAAKEPLRLVNYFAKPQMLFGIPPTCNVIFPSMITNYSYRENFWLQPTRTYVNDQFWTQGLKEDGFTANAVTVGFPPEIDAVLQSRLPHNTDSSTAPVARVNGKSVLVFPEEYFKGPVASRSAVPPWYSLLAQQRATQQRQADEEAADTVSTDPELRDLFFLYGQYEHARTRYEQRGGSVDMIWNPYVVPGFPCLIFDRRDAPLDTTGYVMNVALNMDASANGGGTMSTSINYSFGRTINELLDVMKEDMGRLGVVLGFGPVEPVDSVRAVSQDFQEAEAMYQALFFGRESPKDKKASADLRDIIAFRNDLDEDAYSDDVELDPLVIEGTQQARHVSYLGSGSGGRELPKTNFGATGDVSTHAEGASRAIELREEFAVAAVNGIEALRYIARPICTLEEYIRFIHGGEELSSLQAERTMTDPSTGATFVRPVQVAGLQQEFSYGELRGTLDGRIIKVTAGYYERIRALRPGPGTKPTPAQSGASTTDPVEDGEGSTVGSAEAALSAVDGVPADFPQTRQNWDELLLTYRRDILERQPPQR